MKDNLLKRKLISASDNRNWLSNLQAGILKGNGRDYLSLLFLTFNTNKPEAVKRALGGMDITSAWDQSQHNKRKLPNLTVTNCYLTYKGYKALKISVKSGDSAFTCGMKDRKEVDENENLVHTLGDDPKNWEAPLKKDIHAVLSLANDNEGILKLEVDKYKKEFKGVIKISYTQFGKTYRNQHERPIEHFGYVDGISQPIFFDSDIDRKNTKYWNPEAPLGLVLVEDFAIDQPNCYGSYMVFRKLEQNVKAFKEAEHRLAARLGFTGNTEEAAGAMIIGRFENGLPVVKFGSTESTEIDTLDNDFNYSFDPEGNRCPFHSHIRKTNPRGDNQRLFGISKEEERSHRIVRRGITYGERDFSNKEYPSKDVGLLFICFQSDIANQFEFIQKSWVNNNDFPIPFTGLDPIIGQGENRRYSNGKDLEQQWKKANRKTFSRSFSSFVTVKGGEYFFAPSIPFFKTLASPTSYQNK